MSLQPEFQIFPTKTGDLQVTSEIPRLYGLLYSRKRTGVVEELTKFKEGIHDPYTWEFKVKDLNPYRVPEDDAIWYIGDNIEWIRERLLHRPFKPPRTGELFVDNCTRVADSVKMILSFLDRATAYLCYRETLNLSPLGKVSYITGRYKILE